jgi:diguanylate cyclase (GGDEF)-like protein
MALWGAEAIERGRRATASSRVLGSALLDRSLDVVWASEQLVSFLGLTGEFPPIVELLHPDDLEEALAMLAAEQTENIAGHPDLLQRYTVDLRLKHANGGWLECEINATNLFDDPQVDGFLVQIMHESMQRVRFRSLIAAAKGEPISKVLDQLLHSFSRGGGAEQRCVIADAQGTILASVVSEFPVGTFLPAPGQEPGEFAQFLRWSEDIRNPKSGEVLGALHVFDHLDFIHPFSIRNAIDVAEVASVILDRYQWDGRLQTMAWTDELTGLANRAKFRFEMKRAEEQRCSTNEAFAPSLLFVDLDRFKIINDTFGHQVGDAVLREVGRRLLGVSTANDVVARIGGDEFAVLCVRTESETLALLARVQGIFEAPVLVDGREHPISGSVGCARATDGDVSTNNRMGIDELLSAADTAMFAEKLRRRSADNAVSPQGYRRHRS